MMGSFIKYHSVNIQQLKQFDLRIVYAETNRVDVGSLPPAPLIAPYVRVSYTALHTYRRTQTLIQGIRVDQAMSALAFISPVNSR